MKKRFLGYQVMWLMKERGEPYTVEEVAVEIGCERHCAYRHLKELWSLDLIYVYGWDRTYHHWMPVYRWGNKEDAEKPAPLNNTETSRRYRRKKSELRSVGSSNNQVGIRAGNHTEQHPAGSVTKDRERVGRAC